MITIGAQANGYITGQDSTALSSINAGLIDRVKPVIQDAGKKDIEQPPQPLNVQYADQINAFLAFLAKIGSVNGAYPGWDQEAIDNFKNTNNAFTEYAQYKATIDAQVADPNKPIGSPTIGFLPFDLTLTIDGLSGMKVYQKYIIDADFLPSNYPKSLEFLIKGITHTIQNNQWITTLESVAIPKNPFGMKNAQGQTYNGSPATSEGRPVGVAATTGQAPRGNTFAQRGNTALKQVLISAGYREGTSQYEFAYAIGTKEGWSANANGGKGSRSYRNNNPGNLDYSDSLKSIDPKVTLENNPYGSSRFAHFTTAELGAKALVQTKLDKWAKGKMPITSGNQTLIVQNNGGAKYKKGTNPTIAQFFYTYAPPNENNTERYINDVLTALKKSKPNINRNSLVKDILT